MPWSRKGEVLPGLIDAYAAPLVVAVGDEHITARLPTEHPPQQSVSASRHLDPHLASRRLSEAE